MNIDKLKDSKEFMRTLMEVAVAPIFIMDKDMCVQSYNDSFSMLFSKEENEIIGKLPGNALGCVCLTENEVCGDSESCIKCLLRKQMEKTIKENKAIDRNVIEKQFKINGEIVNKQLSVSIKPVDFDNEKYYIGIFDDVSDIMRLQKKVLAQNEKMQRDLLFARGLQRGLLPKENKIGPLEFSYIFKPCETLGGDFLDFYRIDRNNIGFIIADVAGHGIASSMFTIFLYSLINRNQRSPKALLEEAFKEFSKFNVTTETYITMMAAVINTRKKTVTFANAGFTNPPSLVSEKGVETIDIGGIPISNWVDEAYYEEKQFRFKTGDRLIFFSDGITELRTDTASFIGGEYLSCALADLSKDAKTLIDDVFNDSLKKTEYTVNDDVTIALIDFK